MKIAIIASIIFTALFLAYSYLTRASNKKVERQKYQVIKLEKGFEIRFYPRAIMASVSTQRVNNDADANKNFRKLAGYIFGANENNTKIPMTAPVHMEHDSTANRMSFVLPAGYDLKDLPHPSDTNIKIHYSEEGYYAALSFSGFAGAQKIKNKEAALSKLLNQSGYHTIGNFCYLGYNAPWEILNRQNDVIVKISYNQN